MTKKKSSLEISTNKNIVSDLFTAVDPRESTGGAAGGEGPFSWWNVACDMHSDFLLCLCLKLHLASSPSQADLPCLPCSWVLLA